jgi:hypothetical protein
MLYNQLLGSRVTLSLTLTWKALAMKAVVILEALQPAVRDVPDANHGKVTAGCRNLLF